MLFTLSVSSRLILIRLYLSFYPILFYSHIFGFYLFPLVGLAVSLFMILMVIYVLKRICISSHTRMGAPGESIDKISRGLYVRMPSLGEEWEEMDEGEEGWRPEGTFQEK